MEFKEIESFGSINKGVEKILRQNNQNINGRFFIKTSDNRFLKFDPMFKRFYVEQGTKNAATFDLAAADQLLDDYKKSPLGIHKEEIKTMLYIVK